MADAGFGPEMLDLFPPFIQLELIDDDAFRERLGLQVEGTLSLGEGDVKFPRGAFMDAVRALYASSDRRAQATDEDGTCWDLIGEKHGDADAIAVQAGGQRHLIPGFAVLNPDHDERTRQFTLMLREAGITPASMTHWSSRLQARTLENEEVRHFDLELARTPVVAMRKLDRELSGASGRVETLAPPHRIYFERLVGAGTASDIAEYAEKVARPLIADLLAWDEARGARLALLLASHASIMAASALIELPTETLTALASWAIEEGDPLCKVGMIEVGLAALSRAAELAGPIQQLVEQIRDLDADDPAGPLQLMMATFVIVDAELSRLKIVDDWPPFRRRIAALAQAGLIQRAVRGRVDVAHFAKWALGYGTRRFYMQTLADLRVEPRWLPDLASPSQLKAELIGRVHNATGRSNENLPDGALRRLLLGKGTDDLPQHIVFPDSLLPGPIEGSAAAAGNPIPPEFEEILDRSLGSASLGPESVIAMINTRGLFNIGSEKVDRAIALIRQAGYRFPSDLEIEKRDALLWGLAAVASSARSEDLAGDVRLMMRRVRVDRDAPLAPARELIVAAMAAGAFSDLSAWLTFLGDWATELAFAVDEESEAAELYSGLDTLCVIEPALRRSAGRGLACLQVLLAM